MAMIRLHVSETLSAGARLEPSADQARYLLSVMRLGVGDALLLFNGRDGEWRAQVARRRGGAASSSRSSRCGPSSWARTSTC
jgi:16S rRNA (uracil1498-N3)-methyltransferase